MQRRRCDGRNLRQTGTTVVLCAAVPLFLHLLERVGLPQLREPAQGIHGRVDISLQYRHVRLVVLAGVDVVIVVIRSWFDGDHEDQSLVDILVIHLVRGAGPRLRRLAGHDRCLSWEGQKAGLSPLAGRPASPSALPAARRSARGFARSGPSGRTSDRCHLARHPAPPPRCGRWLGGAHIRTCDRALP